MSFKYMAIGSLAFSPILKAVVGAVGETKTSACWKAFSKSLEIKVLTFCALP